MTTTEKISPVKVLKISLSDSGMPSKLVSALQNKGIKTLEDLLEKATNEPKTLTELGDAAVKIIRKYLIIIVKLRKQQRPFDSVKELLSFFLTDNQLRLIELRYKLKAPFQNERINYSTLQNVAQENDVSRERVRQVVDDALKQLSCSLARYCFIEYHEDFEHIIKRGRGIAKPEDFFNLRRDSRYEGYAPAKLMMMLCDCEPDMNYCMGMFNTISNTDKCIPQIINGLTEILKKSERPVPLKLLLYAFPKDFKIKSQKSRLTILQNILPTVKSIRATTQKTFFLSGKGERLLAAQILIRKGRPVHFRELLQEINTVLAPGSRIGSGLLLKILKEDPRFARALPGYYILKKTIH